MDVAPHSETPKIAYIMKCFPRLSETFILHEVLELERQGLALRIFSLLTPEGKINKAAQDVQAKITYIPKEPSFKGIMQLLAATGKRLLTSPLRFVWTVMIAAVTYHHPATPRHLLYAAYLANQLEREGITHIHAHYVNTPTTVANLAHHFTGISYSFTAHAKDIYLSRKTSIAYKIRHARFVATCTGYNQHYLEDVVGQQTKTPIYRIYHGLNLSVFPAQVVRIQRADQLPLILTVARLVEKKGLSYLLLACRRLKDQGYVFHCRIIGEGPLRPELEQLIRDLQLTDDVELWGAETHERVIEMYTQATIKVLPCVISENGDRDGIPNVLAEALYLGVPVISTPISGIPELITSGVNGILVPPRDSESLSFAMARLLDDEALRQRLSVAGHQTIMTHFDMAHNVTRLKHLLMQQVSLLPVVGDENHSQLDEDRKTASQERVLNVR